MAPMPVNGLVARVDNVTDYTFALRYIRCNVSTSTKALQPSAITVINRDYHDSQH